MMDAGTAGIMTAAIGSVTTLGTLLYQGWAHGRQRKWDVEDRARIAAEHGAMIAANTELTQVAAEKADLAYVEANHVNEKLAKLGRAL